MPTYYEFEVSLEAIQPRIWRRFLLRADATFHDLHWTIQDAAPWENYHLFAFRAKKRSHPALATNAGRDCGPRAAAVPLATWFARAGDRCLYEYDFGDGWMHHVTLKAVRNLPERFYRRLLAGERAFPLEDSGGTWGYWLCAAAVGAIDPQEIGASPDDLDDRREWGDPDWHPDVFDLDAARHAFDLRKHPGPPSADEYCEPDDDEGVGLEGDDWFDAADDWFAEQRDEVRAFADWFDTDTGPLDPDLVARLRGIIRIPSGCIIPVTLTPEMHRLLLTVASGDESLAAPLRQAPSGAFVADLTLNQVHNLIDRLTRTAKGADTRICTPLGQAADYLRTFSLPYAETDAVTEIGLPREVALPEPIQKLALGTENLILLDHGLIDLHEFARRTGRTVAGPSQEIGIRLTGAQRTAILENLDLPDDLRQRLSLDTDRAATVTMPLGDAHALCTALEEAAEETTGNLSQKLGRALQRIEDACQDYIDQDSLSGAGNGDRA